MLLMFLFQKRLNKWKENIMSFRREHEAYANAVMVAEAYKLFNRRVPSGYVEGPRDASYARTMADDQRLRPGSPNGWYTATARSTNRAIEDAAKEAIRANRAMVRNGRLVAQSDIDALVNTAAASVFGVAATQEAQDSGTTEGISRRGLLLGLGATVAAVTVFKPSEAHADNNSYISAVRRGAQGHARSRAPSTIRQVAGSLGIRASLDTEMRQVPA
jgi:hypothetical protein